VTKIKEGYSIYYLNIEEKERQEMEPSPLLLHGMIGRLSQRVARSQWKRFESIYPTMVKYPIMLETSNTSKEEKGGGSGFPAINRETVQCAPLQARSREQRGAREDS
jgi:hypothetical protein